MTDGATCSCNRKLSGKLWLAVPNLLCKRVIHSTLQIVGAPLSRRSRSWHIVDHKRSQSELAPQGEKKKLGGLVEEHISKTQCTFGSK